MIKILKSDLNSVAFVTESLDLYPLPARVADSLSGDELLTSEFLPVRFKGVPIGETPAKITRLELLITQTCNIQCSYCIIKPYMGSRSDRRIMSPVTARVAIEKVLRSLPEVPEIVFFGGEPLMGFPAIQEAVQTGEECCTAHQGRLPLFAVTTNGTLIDKEMAEFFKRHNFEVNISLDGPQHIHDKQRQFPCGKGTYDIVKKKIDLLRGAGVEFRIEAVFTENHTKYKETIESTYEFLSKLGARDISLSPAIGGSPDESLDRDFLAYLEKSYASSTERIMDRWLTDSPIKIPYWLDILHRLMSRKGKTIFCDAGYGGITVDCSGKVFPCHTLMSDHLCMGSVFDSEFPGEDFRRVAALMRQTTKDSFPKCVKCWAKTLCSPCYGDTFAACGTLTAPRESICTIIRSVTKATLLKVSEFMTDDEKWKRFIERVNSHMDATMRD